MGNIKINSAQLTNLGKDQVFTKSAYVGYNCSALSDENLEYEWTINGQQPFTVTESTGTVYIDNLKSAGKNEISGSVKVTTAGAEQTVEVSISVYTRPGPFTDYIFAADTTIESDPDGLTAEKVDKWITHCNAFNNWFNQPSSGDDESDVGPNCKVSRGDYITASWYNKCVEAIADQSKRPDKVTGGSEGTIITTNVFKALGDAISTDLDP